MNFHNNYSRREIKGLLHYEPRFCFASVLFRGSPDTCRFFVTKIRGSGEGKTCTIDNVSHGWSRGQKNEQQNNVPSPKKQCSYRLSGSSENRAFERCKSTKINHFAVSVPSITFSQPSVTTSGMRKWDRHT